MTAREWYSIWGIERSGRKTRFGRQGGFFEGRHWGWQDGKGAWVTDEMRYDVSGERSLMMWVGEFYQMRGQRQICDIILGQVRGNGLCRQASSPSLWEWVSRMCRGQVGRGEGEVLEWDGRDARKAKMGRSDCLRLGLLWKRFHVRDGEHSLNSTWMDMMR